MTAPADIPQVDRTEDFRPSLEAHIRRARRQFARVIEGAALRSCPLCAYHGQFAPYGVPPRIDARCPSCAALERHRLYALMVERLAPFARQHSLLHFAAEGPLRKLIAHLVARYETAEIRADLAPDHVVNIEAIDLPDESYDRVICNHVLEHVDDAQALRELHRILKPGGMAFLTTPLVEAWAQTYENPAVTARKDRNLHFGQGDHIRMFGRDLRLRIAAVGFTLTEFAAVEPDVHRYGLIRGETIFIVTKPVKDAR